jgi:hypothetical protein
MKAAYDALGSNLEADAEMLVIQYLSEKDVKASVQNGRTTNELGTSDTGSHPRNSTDGTYEVVVPKLSGVVKYVNEVMTWLEQQTDSELLHLLHVANIKHYALRKCSHQF